MRGVERPASSSVGATRGDAVLRKLGVTRLELPIPFAEAGGTVNVYLIDNPDGSLTLFDAGIGGKAGRRSLVDGLAAVGRRVEDVRRIIVSHGHLDHYGAARFVHDRSGAAVLVHPQDAAKVLPPLDEHAEMERLGGYLARLGVPAAAIEALRRIYGAFDVLAEQLEEVVPLADGQRLQFRHFAGEIVPMPGHTPGLVCLHVPAHRLMFTSDHLLGCISPNPLIELGPRGEPDKFRALPAYLASADRMRAFDLRWILPGHGVPFTGHRRIIASLRKFYRLRQSRILDVLRRTPQTPYELAHDIFRRRGDDQIFLMLSEIVGNLEVLEEQGAVRREHGTIPYRYGLPSA
jgi:glyoxylase-like metal-dependent hydrolase (beta-lactamase superfamily II)